MSLDKAIQHHKEHRQPYRNSKAFDATCRNHKGCPCCLSNRLHHNKKRQDAADQQLHDYKNNFAKN